MPDSLLPQRWSAPADIPATVGPFAGPAEHDALLKRAMDVGGLIRRHWLLVSLIALASTGVVLYQMRKSRTLYQAVGVIRLVDKSRSLSGGLGTSPTDQWMGPIFSDPVLSQIEVLRSHAVAEEVVKQEGLRLTVLSRAFPASAIDSAYVAPDSPNDTLRLTFEPTAYRIQRGNTETQARYGSVVSLGTVRFMIPSFPRLAEADLAVIPLAQAANSVQANLAARARERTDVIDVSYLAYDPVVAQHVVNAVVRVFQQLSAQTAKQESVRRREFIDQQLAKTDSMLNDAQSAYNNFRSREQVYSSDQKFRAQQTDLATIDIRREELNTDRRMYQALLDALQAPTTQPGSGARLAALASSPGAAANPLISQHSQDLARLQATRDSLTAGTWARNPNDPDVKRIDLLIASTSNKIVGAARGQLAAVDARINSLDELRKSVATQLGMLPETQAEESKLLEQVDTYKREADRLRMQLQSAQIDEAAEGGQVEILDLAATPGYPIGSGRSSRIVLAVLLGLGLGLVAAYVLENKKSVIRKREELEHVLQIPNLAMVPQLKNSSVVGSRLLPRFSRNGNGNHVLATPVSELVTVNDRRSSVAEAYRTLRTNLLFSAAVRSLRSIVVTSPGAAEGKSMTAANLAVAFAQQGHRVLLLDCDLRRPRIHRMFEQPELPGLTNLLIGGTSPDDAIRGTKIDGLWILPAGAMPPNPAELLGSSQMRMLLDQLKDRFDVVICDSPPLLAASDGAILSRMVDGAVVVVRAGRTERAALKTAIQQLSTVGARVLGTVLNDPDAEVPRYADYYGYYYYEQYYGAPEVATPATVQN